MKRFKKVKLTKGLNEETDNLLNKQVLLTSKQIDELLILRNPMRSYEERTDPEKIQTQISHNDWKGMVQEIYECLAHGQGLSQLESWMNSGRILSLCKIFREPSTVNELRYDIIRLFDTLVSLQLEEKCQSCLGEYILEQDILLDLLKLWKAPADKIKSIHINKLIDYLLLIDSSNQLLRQGGFSQLIDQTLTLVKQNLFDDYQIDKTISFSKLLAEYVSASCLNLEAKLYFQNLIFSLLNQLILIKHSSLFQSQVLQSLEFIFRTNLAHLLDTQQEQLYINFSKYQNLFSILLNFSIHQNFNFKKISWTILALLSSSQTPKIQQLFTYIPFFNLLIKAEINPDDPLNDKIQQKIILCIGNLADYGDHMRKHILEHEIMNIMIDSALQKRSQKLKINSYYALINLIKTLNPILLDEIMRNSPIVDLLVDGLITCVQDEKLIEQIFNGLNYLIVKDKDLKNKQTQSLLDQLETKYNLSSIIQLTQSKISKLASSQPKKTYFI